jgi:F0F1-type ATP synthase assembly protein I
VSKPPEEPARPRPKRAAWFRYTDTASVGIEMVVAIAIGAFGGMWLERNVTHWAPWTTLLGIAVGLGAAVKAVVRTARNYKRELAAEAAGRDADDGSNPRED